jgi:hypothetical protein
LVRAGGHGEYEQKFISESRVYVTWDDLAVDLSKIPHREAAYNAGGLWTHLLLKAEERRRIGGGVAASRKSLETGKA